MSGHLLVWLIYGAIAVSTLVTFLLPDTPISRWPWTAVPADFAARYVPAIRKLAAISKFPELTRLYLSLQWLVVTPVLVLAAVLSEEQPDRLRNLGVPGYFLWIAPLIGVVMGWTLIALPFLPPESRILYECEAHPVNQAICVMSESRLWLGFFGVLISIMFTLVVAALLRWPSVIRKYYSN